MTKKLSIPQRLRRQVQERAQGRCEYCLIHEADMYYPHEPDHVVAEKHGGPASLDNLAWACFYCNRFPPLKGTILPACPVPCGATKARTGATDLVYGPPEITIYLNEHTSQRLP